MSQKVQEAKRRGNGCEGSGVQVGINFRIYLLGRYVSEFKKIARSQFTNVQPNGVGCRCWSWSGEVGKVSGSAKCRCCQAKPRRAGSVYLGHETGTSDKRTDQLQLISVQRAKPAFISAERFHVDPLILLKLGTSKGPLLFALPICRPSFS